MNEDQPSPKKHRRRRGEREVKATHSEEPPLATTGFPPPSPKQARILWLSLTSLAVGILLGLIGLLLWGMGWVISRLSAVLLPLAIAGVIAYLLDPLVNYFERKRIARAWSILLVFLLVLLCFLGVVGTVIPRLITQTQALVDKREQHFQTIREKWDYYIEHPPLGIKIPEGWRSSTGTTNQTEADLQPRTAEDAGDDTEANADEADAEEAGQSQSATDSKQSGEQEQTDAWSSPLSDRLVSAAANTLPAIFNWLGNQLEKAASWVGLLIGLALVPVYLFYFLLEKRGIEKNWTDYLPVRESQAKQELVFVLRSINDCLIVFFRGQVLVALCVGALLTIGFMLVGLNYALLLGVMAGLLSIIPYLGVMLSIIPAVVLGIVQFGDWLHPILILLVFVLVQMAEGLLISPKIMGDRVGMHPLTIIIAVMIGTTLMGGILGGVLAIPLTAVLRTLMFRYVWRKR